MKQVYLILAALMMLCLAPMPYGYFQPVRFVAMVAFGLMAYRYYVNNKAVAAVVFGVLALPDYNDMEIKMEPLVKAVYLLFLRHPEGIAFKQLPDYREELTEIYVKLKPAGLTERAMQSIEDVTNPMLNSINEKCARIRGAFVGQFDEYMAKSYYVDGARSEAKRIALDRSLVVWE
ncbi:MAG: hypothetical protein IJ618_03320 [Prevotella sp.]|nr:hypothetical protein [Prevotella sp.]